jgi:DNA polymerase III subunit gamma/tau
MTISKLLFAATLLFASAAPSLAAPQPSVTFHGGSEVELAVQCIKARITPLIKADRTTCEDVANNVVHSCTDGIGCPLAIRPVMADIGLRRLARTCSSPTGSGPEGSSPNETFTGRCQPPAMPPMMAAMAEAPPDDRATQGQGMASPDTTSSPYLVLARKYRPLSFSASSGRTPWSRRCGTPSSPGRIPHAFILTGIRGVGKTTTARILARAVNYEDETGRHPTLDLENEGIHCRAIIEGRHVDVVEMDAASNTGINDIREIIDSVKYGPVSAPYKVYIIDEVHMLSTAAFNGLLKTLEEPPPYVKFIFATTEIRKVPVTILSRCMRFDLRRVPPETMTAHLTELLGKEGIEYEPEALAMIVRAGEGSVRDNQSLLDQAISHGDGKVTAATVKAMLGLGDRAKTIDLFEA